MMIEAANCRLAPALLVSCRDVHKLPVAVSFATCLGLIGLIIARCTCLEEGIISQRQHARIESTPGETKYSPELAVSIRTVGRCFPRELRKLASDQLEFREQASDN